MEKLKLLHDREKLDEVIQDCADLLKSGKLEEFRALYGTLGYNVGVDPRAHYQNGSTPQGDVPDLAPLFIAGLHRSGTTLLENHLGYRFDVSRLQADVPKNEGQFLETVTPSESAFGGPGLFGFDGSMRMSAVADEDRAKALADDMLRGWSPYVVGKSSILLEKSPPNITRLQFLRSLFPTSGIIIMCRDPRVASLATMKWANTTVRDVMLHWHVCYSEALQALDDLCMVVRYEEFCDNPDKILDALGEKFGLKERTDFNSIEAPKQPVNQNAKYIDAYESGAFPLYPSMAWRLLGYDL